VLRAATEQATVADIAVAMSLSEGTVRNHLSSAIQKVGARNRAEAPGSHATRAGSSRVPERLP
jgi:two-component system response regulator DesR